MLLQALLSLPRLGAVMQGAQEMGELQGPRWGQRRCKRYVTMKENKKA